MVGKHTDKPHNIIKRLVQFLTSYKNMRYIAIGATTILRCCKITSHMPLSMEKSAKYFHITHPRDS